MNQSEFDYFVKENGFDIHDIVHLDDLLIFMIIKEGTKSTIEMLLKTLETRRDYGHSATEKKIINMVKKLAKN